MKIAEICNMVVGFMLSICNENNLVVISYIPTGGTTYVGKESMHVIHFHPMFYRYIMDKRNHFYLVLLQENPFFYCLGQIWVHILLSQTPTGGSTNVGREFTNTIQF